MRSLCLVCAGVALAVIACGSSSSGRLFSDGAGATGNGGTSMGNGSSSSSAGGADRDSGAAGTSSSGGADAGAGGSGATGSGGDGQDTGGDTSSGGAPEAGGRTSSGGAPEVGGQTSSGGRATGGTGSGGKRDGSGGSGGVATGGAGGSGTPSGGTGGVSSGGAAGASGGAAGATPGSVICVGSPCALTIAGGFVTEACCIAPTSLTLCLPLQGGQCQNGGTAITCDDASDCAAGQVCCSAKGSLVASSCAAQCDNGTEQLCRTNAECNKGKGSCHPFAGSEYSTCK